MSEIWGGAWSEVSHAFISLGLAKALPSPLTLKETSDSGFSIIEGKVWVRLDSAMDKCFLFFLFDPGEDRPDPGSEWFLAGRDLYVEGGEVGGVDLGV
ncbi:unnamed protein product [Sphagnum jensenii]|uniref:Uncharacterized protein n=1 Tax=Sphagnum jensenii TaxID=128206 RepID=A0ABP1AHU3_9BRYO